MLVAISLLAFIININAPGDPVEKLSNTADKGAANDRSNAKKRSLKKAGLDLCFLFKFWFLERLYFIQS